MPATAVCCIESRKYLATGMPSPGEVRYALLVLMYGMHEVSSVVSCSDLLRDLHFVVLVGG